MKKIIYLLFVLLNLPVNGQIKDQIQTAKVTTINTKALDPGIGPNKSVYPIISGKVSATPISIPSPNNKPFELPPQPDRMSSYSNYPYSVITGCSFLSYRDNILNVHVSYTIKTKNNAPIYAGAWFYDKDGNTVEVGYIPQEIENKPSGSTDVQMRFTKFPILTEYIEVMILQNGKEITKRRFDSAFKWNMSQPTYASAGFAKIVDTNMLEAYIPDLEITDIKAVNNQQNTLPFENYCNLKNKMIFITNRGSKESSSYILTVGYIKYKGNRGRYTEIKRIAMNGLPAGSQTYQIVTLPDDANNIKTEIKYNYGNNGEVNSNNNSMEKRCTKIK